MPVARDFGDSQKKILINIDQYRSNKLYKLVEIREKTLLNHDLLLLLTSF